MASEPVEERKGETSAADLLSEIAWLLPWRTLGNVVFCGIVLSPEKAGENLVAMLKARQAT